MDMTENKFIVWYLCGSYTVEEFVDGFNFKVIASSSSNQNNRYGIGKIVVHATEKMSYYKTNPNSFFKVFNNKSSAIKYLVLKGAFLNKEET